MTLEEKVLEKGNDEEKNVDTNNLTGYVVTRWYRAPELLLTCEPYSYA
eukprot:CAMPEP_0197296356 /NCGR_PEP_ID=MMETSP0890-20130614/38173_1 /TAXON_ID=44058 ORGANISM="Aureoumbra lagunensis, Strain CCMP1510" /NCGR_SAMPLE_ID=MMETSP0890 /ASSEMBLY_ACC=CAM_ASM_000533 /LENGTH=47 /DNA_ID= /DNA_START= /DNA_END= /DNA_ORIENTATION=